MKHRRYPLFAATLAGPLAALFVSQSAQAAGPYYWDNNDNAAGFGTATGTWAAPTTGNATQGWSNDPAGTTTPVNVTTSTIDAINFGTATDGLGAGTITVSGTVDSGNITFGSASGAIVLSSGILNLAATSTITVNNSSDTISSKITGAGTSLIKAGSGTLTLSGDNTFAGGLNFTAGALNINSNTALGTGGLGINSGGTIDNTSGGLVTISNNITSSVNTTFGGSYALTTTGSYAYNNNNRVLQVNGSGAFTVGTFANSGGNKLRKRGTGTLAITGAWTSGAGIEFDTNAGTVLIGNKASLGTGSLDVISGGSGTLKASTTLTGTDKIANAVTLGGALTLGGSSDFELGGAVSSTGSLTKSDANTVILSGANTYTGATAVNAGTLKAGIASVANTSGAFGNNSAVTMANFTGATLDITGFNTQVGSLTGGGANGGNVTLGSATLTVGGNNTSPAAYAGLISGTGGVLTKIGSGTLILSNANNYTGGTNINAGILHANNASALGTTGNITFGGGTLLYGSTQNYGSRIKSSSAIKLDFNGQSPTLTGIDNTNTSGLLLSNSGSSNTITLSAANSHSGGTTVGTKIRANLTNSGGFGSGTVTIDSGGQVYLNSSGMAVSNNFNLSGDGWTGESPRLGAIRMGSNTSITSSSTVTLASAATVTVDSGATGTIAGKITGGGTLSITSTGSNSTLNLSNSTSDYNGGTTVSDKVRINLTNAAGLGSGLVTVNNGGQVYLNGSLAMANNFNISGAGWVGDSTPLGAIRMTGGSSIGSSATVTLTATSTITTSGNSTIAGKITGSGGLTINTSANASTDTLILSNSSNDYSGATTVTNGKLVVNGNISTSSLTTVNSGATLGGTGTVGKTVINGTLAVGNSPGTMTFTDTLALNGTTVMEIDGTAGAGVTGGNDFANLTGAGVAGVLTYGGTLTLDLGVIFTNGSYTWDLFNFTSETGTFATIALTDQYSGNLLDTDLNGVWDLTSGNNTWQFTESTGVLGLTVVPEPRAALLGGLGLIALLRRRRAS